MQVDMVLQLAHALTSSLRGKRTCQTTERPPSSDIQPVSQLQLQLIVEDSP
jgi:hypothetical protein